MARSAAQELTALEVPRALRVTQEGEETVAAADLVAVLDPPAEKSRTQADGSEGPPRPPRQGSAARWIFDQLDFARQIGLLPPEGSFIDQMGLKLYNASARLKKRLRRR